MADVEAFAPAMQDVSSGPRFASIKIDSANLERVLSSRDGSFIVNRIRGALGFWADLSRQTIDCVVHRSKILDIGEGECLLTSMSTLRMTE